MGLSNVLVRNTKTRLDVANSSAVKNIVDKGNATMFTGESASDDDFVMPAEKFGLSSRNIEKNVSI